jgi:hypothetical protein
MRYEVTEFRIPQTPINYPKLHEDITALDFVELMSEKDTAYQVFSKEKLTTPQARTIQGIIDDHVVTDLSTDQQEIKDKREAYTRLMSLDIEATKALTDPARSDAILDAIADIITLLERT